MDPLILFGSLCGPRFDVLPLMFNASLVPIGGMASKKERLPVGNSGCGRTPDNA